MNREQATELSQQHYHEQDRHGASMDHAPTAFEGPVNEVDFLADRQRFWFAFTKFVFWIAAGIALLLILMTVFLV
jgi:hypothetical protein